VAATRMHAAAAIEAATSDGYRYRMATAKVLHGWALAAGGSSDEGIAELEDGLALSRETGAHMDDPYHLALLAEASAPAGRSDDAFAALEAARAHAPAGRSFFFASELLRIEGELLLRLGKPEDGDTRLREALRLARTRQSPSLELRAALALAPHLRDDETAL